MALDIMEEKPQTRKAHRHECRMLSVQFFYMWEMSKEIDLEILLDVFFDMYVEDHRSNYGFAEELIRGASEQIEAIDEIIRGLTENWSFNRIAKTDLAILRMAIYELMYRQDIPPIVSINEAIDLSKEFSGDDARRFINGILDRVKDQIDRPLREPNTGKSDSTESN